MTTQIVHGIGVYTYLSDENQTSGTTWVLETLNRTLQAVNTTLGRAGKPTPPVLKFFADNTPKDTQLQRNEFALQKKVSRYTKAG